MADSKFIRFFDKEGQDMNLGPTHSFSTSLYDGSTASTVSYEGTVFFPRVSVGLIESQQIYLLEEVTGPTSSYYLRSVKGTAAVTAGNPTVTGTNSDFSVLKVGYNVKIGSQQYSVIAVSGTASFQVSPTPSSSITTQDVYFFDYLSYNQLRSSPDTFSETLEVSIIENQKEYFLYSINYDESVPLIQRSYESSFQMIDGSADVVDSLTGRISLANPVTVPTQLNLGFCSGPTATYGDIYEKTLKLEFVKNYQEQLTAVPYVSGNYVFLTIGGTSHDLLASTVFELQGATATGSTVSFYSIGLTAVSASVSGSDTVLKISNFSCPPIGAGNFSNYRLKWTNREKLATLNLYGETEGEDERFRLVLENFGKKIDFDKEYIFRESDIDEDKPDYTLLNKKRKELLLEGDNIYPYLGSYKALINVINFFGYYDLRIKEYFLNVDSQSANYGKYMHVLIPRDAAQRSQVKTAWEQLPSTIYKKTSLFGLFYDLNVATENVDNYGIPIVEDAFVFSPEEVLIKLFGLKELLKKEYLPLNARIYDITGEGIYFERIRLDSWADNLNHLVINLGSKPKFKIFPEGHTYISDIRRVDDFYKNRIIANQGLSGFVSNAASTPLITPAGYTGSIGSLYGTYLDTYNDFIYTPSDEVVDTTWQYLPPGISNPDFNLLASKTIPLPDENGVLAGGPILLEAFFDITWQDSDFTWGQLGILGPSASILNINIWTWESLGRGQFIDMRWVVQKGGANGFYYDSGRKSIGDFLVETPGATSYSFPAKLSVDVNGGQVTSVSIVSAGFGYTSTPNVSVAWPGGTGNTASISVSVDSNGYVVGAVITNPGSGYNFEPFVYVEPPEPLYEVSHRYLDALSLPYTGTYDVGLYLYDITNNFSIDFQKYEVDAWNVDFVSISRSETPERTWNEFSVIPPPIAPGATPSPIAWEDVTGPWYYPMHTKSSWGETETSWESLNFSSYDGNSLYEYDLNTSVLEINREQEYVVLTGDLTGNLQNLSHLNVGDYLFFSREDSDLIKTNLEVPVNNFGGYLKGLSGSGTYDTFMTGASGATSVSTSIYDTTPFLAAGDQLWLNGSWYGVSGVTASSITLSSSLKNDVLNVKGLRYPSNGQLQVGYSGPTASMNTYSRILVSDVSYYEMINTTVDFYRYVDGLTSSGNTLTITAKEDDLKELILMNSPSGASSSLHLSWGMFNGTYAIEITNISLTGNNTQFRLNDVNKELYKLDGNFMVRFADYDVDYAENRIGPNSLNYENLDEVSWSENPFVTWFGAEYHGGSLCGFVIPFVSPGGIITVDENPSFSFSGNFAINSTKSGLTVAAQELNKSLNPGISKYSYKVLPEDELYIKDSTGVPIDVAVNASPGATSIQLSSVPDGWDIRIPAVVSVTVLGGTVISATIDNPGWGYTSVPSIELSHPGGSGTAAVLSCTLSGLPYQGQIATVSVVSGGSGYTSAPSVQVDPPEKYKSNDNYVWTGMRWVEVESIVSNQLNLAKPLNFPVSAGSYLLLPYQYHKQLAISANPTAETQVPSLAQFYFFIHGKAKNPSNEMLSYINFANGCYSEWVLYPDRTYTYPLRNSFLFLSDPSYSNLTQDVLYNKWVYEGSDYPPLSVDNVYSSDVLSYSSRIPYSETLQSAFSFIDTVVTSQQRAVPVFTPVVFSYDKCRIPGKKNPQWSIYEETSGKVVAMSNEAKLMWNFTKKGTYTVYLKLEDSNGNVTSGQKNSFIVV